jgi:hypothetical protein
MDERITSGRTSYSQSQADWASLEILEVSYSLALALLIWVL